MRKIHLNLMSNTKSHLCHICTWLSFLIIIALPVKAQEGVTRQAPRTSERSSSQPIDQFPAEQRRILPGDVLDIQVEKAPELSGQFKVDAKGEIYMKFLGNIMTRDLTLDELNQKITEGLRGRYLTNPEVRVAMSEYYKNSFIIQGAVKKPGVYQFIEERPTFWTLIVNAGGFEKECGTTAFVIRTSKISSTQESGQTVEADKKGDSKETENDVNLNREVIRVKISGLMKGDLRQDIQLLPGDVVTVPSADVFFIAGEVNAPGRFTLAEGTTLRQAISLAQGTTLTAAKGKGKIFRENSTTGSLEELAVDIGAVMEGKKPDIPLVANDIVVVPGSRFKSVGTALLRSLGLSTIRIPYGRY